MRNSALVAPTVFLHDAVHRPTADVNAGLLEGKPDSFHAVVSVVRMLLENFFDSDRKKLPAAALFSASQPALVAGFADLHNAAHGFRRVNALAFEHEPMALTDLYFLRSFAKKLRASLRISFAVCRSETSRSSSRMRLACSSGFSVFAGGLFRRILCQSASV